MIFIFDCELFIWVAETNIVFPHPVLNLILRRSRSEVFIREAVLKICSKFTGEHRRTLDDCFWIFAELLLREFSLVVVWANQGKSTDTLIETFCLETSLKDYSHSRNGESGNGMKEIMGTWAIMVGTRVIRVGKQEIKVGMQGIGVGMLGMQ